INAITTNETYFFRHTKQFNYLHDVLFPSFIANQTNFPKKEVSIWSAASSTGEEPYSLGITCKHFFQNNPSWRFKLYASDINTDVIQQAKEGVYNERAVKYVPDSFKKKFFTQEILDQGGINQKKYKISSEIKKIVEFRQHNLLKRFPVDNINIIFIRNVMIYFDKQTKTKVFNNFFDVLAPKGYIFISLSESLSEFEPKIKSMGTAIYQKV
ncbi:MAG: protein-glutamate O-methyltransferase CheR, partial [Candidatus Omnitrophica bacterium]|nr:protein-glutamate O-methyltransferase CheR [Candidatus Omnitrophota bacterium]